MGPAGDRRQQDRRRRQCRRRAGGQGSPRRLHAAAGHGRHRRHQPVSLQGHALRQHQELRAGGAGRRGGQRAGRPSQLPRQVAQGVRRVLQGAGPQQGELRLARGRRHRTPRHGVSVGAGRHQARARRLSRQLAGHEGPFGRPHPHHHGQPAALPAAHPVRRVARAGRQLGQALVLGARGADGRRAGLSRLRCSPLVVRRRPGRHAGRDRQEAVGRDHQGHPVRGGDQEDPRCRRRRAGRAIPRRSSSRWRPRTPNGRR